MKRNLARERVARTMAGSCILDRRSGETTFDREHWNSPMAPARSCLGEHTPSYREYKMTVVPAYYDHFDFDLARAVLKQLIQAFEKLQPSALTLEHLATIEHRPGVYQIYHAGDLVYVGKADKDLAKRLTDHFWTIKGRLNIQIEQLSFCCVTIHPNWEPLTHEAILIKHYKRGGTYNGMLWDLAIMIRGVDVKTPTQMPSTRDIL